MNLFGLITQALKGGFGVAIIVVFVLWMVQYYFSDKSERLLYPKELIAFPKILKSLMSFLFFYMAPIIIIGELKFHNYNEMSNVFNHYRLLFNISFISGAILSLFVLAIDGKNDDKYDISQSKFSFITRKGVKIPISLVAILFNYFAMSKYIGIMIISFKTSFQVNSFQSYIENNTTKEIFVVSVVFIILALILLLPSYLIFSNISKNLLNSLLEKFEDESMGIVYLKSGKKVYDVYIYNPPLGNYLYVGNHINSLKATQRLAIKKQEIEMIKITSNTNKKPDANPIFIDMS